MRIRRERIQVAIYAIWIAVKYLVCLAAFLGTVWLMAAVGNAFM